MGRRLTTTTDGTRVIIESEPGSSERVYRLAPEGVVFLTQLLRLGDNDEVRASDLRLMVDRGWAKREESPTPTTATGSARELADRPNGAGATGGADPADLGVSTGSLSGTASAESPFDDHVGARENRPLARRSRGREVALQLLYQLEQNPGIAHAEVDRFIARRLRDPKLIAFTRAIVDGVREHQKHLDTLISDVAENWRIDRMAAIDRNILRVGAYEMLYCSDVPTKVAINEALELAKRYSTAQSSRFVNGILDRLQNAQPEANQTPPAEDLPA